MSETVAELCKDPVFNSFYLEHAESLFSFMYYRCGDKDQAKDLMQEAFMRVWDKCGEINFDKAKTYLFSTANNLFLNVVKHQKVVLEYTKMEPARESTNEDPEFIMQENEYMKKLQNAIANLTDAQREVFLLNRMEGKKYREIADMLGVSIKAVEKRMMGALTRLREEFEYFKS